MVWHCPSVRLHARLSLCISVCQLCTQALKILFRSISFLDNHKLLMSPILKRFIVVPIKVAVTFRCSQGLPNLTSNNLQFKASVDFFRILFFKAYDMLQHSMI